MTVPTSFRIAFASTALVLVLLASGLALGSGPDGRVRGYVTDFSTGSAVSGASVRIEASDLPWRFEGTTDGAGYFDVVVPPHRYSLEATSPAHVVAAVGIAVGSGETVWRNVTLTAASALSAGIRGYVTDTVSGAPVTTGQVLAGPPSWNPPSYRNSSALNASGYYAMDLVPGSYDLRTIETVGYDEYEYYPVSVSTGNPLWYNFTLNPDLGVAWVNGTVRDADTSAPVGGARVTGRVGAEYLPTATSDAAGLYSLQSPTGDLEIAADAAGYAPITTSMYVWSTGEYTQDLYLPPLSATLRGYVLDGVTGRGLPGLLVTVDPLFSTGYSDRATTDASGYYGFSLPPDDFVLRASASGYTAGVTYVLFWSSQDVWANVTLWPIISRVSGYLVDGTTGAFVPGLNMIVIDSRSGYSAGGVADGAGFFTFPLPPSPAITVAAYGSAVYAGNISYIGTVPNVTTWLNITVDRLDAQIFAVVTDITTGLAVSGASVTASWLYGSSTASSNGTGRATVAAPAGLKLYVFTFATGYLTWSGTMTPAAGPNPFAIELWPDLPQGVFIQGYVRDNGTGTGLWPGRVDVSGYDGLAPYDYLGGTGYYSLSTVAMPQTVRATANGYAAGVASIAPAPGESLWLNFSLDPDTVAPAIRSFTATPATNIGVTNPTTLLGDVAETSLEQAIVSILMLRSASAGIGTFLNLGRLDPAGVAISQPTPGSVSVSGGWDTRTPVARLSDGANSEWWPTISLGTPFQVFMNGYWDNATLAAPIPGSAVFDTRSGNLLFVVTSLGFFGPLDQPASTFQPLGSGLRIDMTSAAILGALLLTGPTFSVGSLRISESPVVPSGQYGALLETYDSGGQYDAAVALMRTGPDTVPPVANAGPDRSVDEDAPTSLDGTASSDNVGIASYTWTFIDGGLHVLNGATATYTFTTPGTFVITLTVQDADGNVDIDTVLITVRDVTDPTIAVTAPSENASVSGAFLVSADATDNVGVVRVELLVDGVSIGNDTAAPFEFTVQGSTLTVANHTLTIVAWDAAGNSASGVRHVNVTASPPGGGPTGRLPDIVVFLGIALLIAAVVAVAVLLVRRRRPRGPTAAPPESPAWTEAPPPPPSA